MPHPVLTSLFTQDPTIHLSQGFQTVLHCRCISTPSRLSQSLEPIHAGSFHCFQADKLQSKVPCPPWVSHHSKVKTMGFTSAWNTHIHPLADFQFHPQGAAPTTFSPQVPLPLSVPCNLTRSRPHITSLHLKISFSFVYFLWSLQKDPFLFLGFMPEPFLPLPSPRKISSCFLSTPAASLWLTPKCFPPPRKSFLHSDFSWASIPPSTLLSQLNFSKKYYMLTASTSSPPTQSQPLAIWFPYP